MIRIGIILGSVHPNRNGEQVAKWVQDMASRRNDAEFTLIDLRDYSLPHLIAGRRRLGTSMARVEWYLTRGSAPDRLPLPRHGREDRGGKPAADPWQALACGSDGCFQVSSARASCLTFCTPGWVGSGMARYLG